MNDTLKVAGRIGAELGAAKAENDRLRGLLAEVVNYLNGSKLNRIESGSILHRKLFDALSQQPEPTDTFTAVDMATAAAQGFRDGQAAVEQAPAQDERHSGPARYIVAPTGRGFWPFCVRSGDGTRELFVGHRKECERVAAELAVAFEDGKFVATRPAQTEQHPVAHRLVNAEGEVMTDWHDGAPPDNFIDLCGVAMAGTRVELAFAAPVAQTAPQPEQSWRETMTVPKQVIVFAHQLAEMVVQDEAPRTRRRTALALIAALSARDTSKFEIGDRVKKTSGSEWVGHVCGTYSTALTPEGYAVESEAHAGSVQIYPAKALEAVDD
jgi:hypothetical protein